MQSRRQTIAGPEERRIDGGGIGWDEVPRRAGCPRTALALLGFIALAGCTDEVEIDPGETALTPPPTAEFDPGEGIVPLPNALLINPATGRLQVPARCGEEPGSAAEGLRNTLNQLDGFGTSRLDLVATFSEPVDAASLTGRVALVRVAERGAPVLPPEGPVPIDVLTASTPRAAADCASSSAVPAVVIRPRGALRDASSYAVLIARGVTTEDGAEFEPSVTWSLVRQEEAPVRFAEGSPASAAPVYNATPFDAAEPEGLASLRGLDQLWRGFAPLLTGLDALAPLVLPGQIESRDDVLLAWAFTTQTITDVFNPDVAGSPANAILAGSAPLVVGAPAAGAGAPVSIEQAFAAALPGVPCAVLGCAAIGTLYAAGPASMPPTFTSSSYLTGDDCSLPAAATGAFADPVAPPLTCQRQLPVLAVVPSTPAPATGYPTLIFAHGIGRSKEDLLPLAGTLAAAGIASVSVDALDHGVRAVQISTDAAAGCDGAGEGSTCADVFGPTCAPQCYAPLLSSNLAVTRDHLRQTVLDHLALAHALAGCAEPGACGTLQVDPARIGFVGQSLGALIGGVSVAVASDVSAAVLNVGGADWLRVLTETDTLAIRCPLVDALIAGGVIDGDPWNGGANPAATCVGDAWKDDPGFRDFASAARWILDPVDAVNFAGAYAGAGAPPVLVSEVVGDPVVPNSATATFAEALALTPSEGAVAASAAPEPTPAAVEPGSVWIRYQNLDANPAMMFPGNAYGHGSLLQPAAPSPSMGEASGQLGTIRMRVDAVSFLVSHLGGAL
jgi:dienelactone hydrolase